MGLLGMNSSILSRFFLHIVLFFLCSRIVEGNETERLSLLAFKAQITDDPLGALSSWNESLHFCEWSGVTCGKRHQRVVELDLHSCKLVGSLSPHIGNLSFLRILNLEKNSLSNNIPNTIGRLFRLEKLILTNNTFTGEIPINISRCSNIQSLHLQGNKLIGKLPAELGALSKLQEAFFHTNQLVGEIPPSFGNLSSLETIDGHDNSFQGVIPDSIGQLKRLKSFAFGTNKLTGMIPLSVYSLSSLTIFSLENNHLHGTLPPDLGLTLPNLQVLKIHNNNFSGLIPVTISNATSLTNIEISDNMFTGKVPTLARLHNLKSVWIAHNNLGNGENDELDFVYSLSNITQLAILNVEDNNLGGMLPEMISNLSTKLTDLKFGRNPVRGSIPADIGNLINLEDVGFQVNQLNGTIPSSIGTLKKLVRLYLNGNDLSGSIPASLGNITLLREFDLSQNNLEGNIPSSLGNCYMLLFIDLSQNILTGPIPKEVFGISSLSIFLVLSENQLTGSLPTEVGKLILLGSLDISKNRLEGEIPRSLGSCISLRSLHLEGNFFQGNIPESLNALRAIEDINLSNNSLTGQIPKFLGELMLLMSLDLSYNDLEGEVPVQGAFENASLFSVQGNRKLCGGIHVLNLPKCTYNESQKSKFSAKLILIIAVPCGFLGVLLIKSGLVLYCSRKTGKKSVSVSSWEVSFRRVTYEELLQATDGFASVNLIGVGSFGSVYKGILTPDGMIVAVKVFDLLRKGASKSFIAECEALINIRHRNLVKVLTACSSIDFKGNDFKALVYGFMANGSLDEWLHPIQRSDEEQEPGNLNFIQRLNIAIDVASALNYLHHHCRLPIVHCDLKPSNVLLDGDMIACVGDFGLARLLRDASDQLSSGQSSSVGVKGTIGYAAPEYGLGSEVSTYGDVYSYGILLLEMFTGKRPTDAMFKDGLTLHNFAINALPDHVAEVADPTLIREPEETAVAASYRRNNISIDKILKCLISILKIGVTCSEEVPTGRMDISNVVDELQRIRNSLIRTRRHRQPAIIVQPV